MQDAEFRPGFRFSVVDLVVTLIGSLAIALTSRSTPDAALIIAVALAHFFLFCNVFRLSRPLELCWAAVFVGLAAMTLIVGRPSWPITLMVCATTAALFIAVEMRKPSYHGVGWRQINPGLRQWWAARNQDAQRKSFS